MSGPRGESCFREALRLAPSDRISEVYALTLLAEMGREKQALAGIKAFMRSAIAGEAERIRDARAPGRAQRRAEAERKTCRERQKALARLFDAARVRAEIRGLAAWASRYGVGDDVCRPFLLRSLTKAQRGKLIRAVDAHAGAIQAWLDGFPRGKMTTEAAFLYLAEGVEEIR